MRSFLIMPGQQPKVDPEKAALAMNMPTDIGSGMQAVADAIAYRQRQFPKAPGGAPVKLGSLFGMGRGGLY